MLTHKLIMLTEIEINMNNYHENEVEINYSKNCENNIKESENNTKETTIDRKILIK